MLEHDNQIYMAVIIDGGSLLWSNKSFFKNIFLVEGHCGRVSMVRGATRSRRLNGAVLGRVGGGWGVGGWRSMDTLERTGGTWIIPRLGCLQRCRIAGGPWRTVIMMWQGTKNSWIGLFFYWWHRYDAWNLFWSQHSSKYLRGANMVIK